MFKQIVEAKGEEITIRLPKELADKKVEVVVQEWKDSSYRNDMSFEEAKAYFQSLAADLSHYKFNRGEANGH
ncbi:MAG TPA: hypothetical protein VF609_16295 [Flavisolibacter sp.]|jgi:hypothetical protein